MVSSLENEARKRMVSNSHLAGITIGIANLIYVIVVAISDILRKGFQIESLALFALLGVMGFFVIYFAAGIFIHLIYLPWIFGARSMEKTGLKGRANLYKHYNVKYKISSFLTCSTGVASLLSFSLGILSSLGGIGRYNIQGISAALYLYKQTALVTIVLTTGAFLFLSFLVVPSLALVKFYIWLGTPGKNQKSPS